MKIEVEAKGATLTVSLSGALGEDAGKELRAVRPRLAGQHVDFDLGGVASVNTPGLRAWSDFLLAVRAETTFAFRNCPAPYVDCLNLLPHKLFAESVQSIVVPFRCAACVGSADVAFEVAALRDATRFPPAACPTCGQAMSAIVAPGDYLEFLRPDHLGAPR